MEMRAIEDIPIGQDLTPPLRPLAAVLRDFALSSHCSACFSTLPPHPIPHFTPAVPPNSHHVPSDTPTPLYCSPTCSSYDSPLHLSSGEAHLLQSPPSAWDDSADLRLSLRLVPIFQKESSFPGSPGPTLTDQKSVFRGTKNYPFQENENGGGPDDHIENAETMSQNDAVLERIAGLMTNREKLVFGQCRNNPDGNTEKISEGAKLIAEARRVCSNEDMNVENRDDDFVLEEMVLCLVLTNAVEVQDKSGCSIGVAVYGAAFSWINHSCSPNACYRFLVGPEDSERPRPLRIASAGRNRCDVGCALSGEVEKNEHGPRVVVRSIKDVKMGEEVTIAYTDLLQPKETRRAEIWFKYRFNCSCERCNASPTTYVDDALQEPLSAINLDKTTKSFEDAITDYLSSGDPISCCNDLENLLTQCHLMEPKSPRKTKLTPLNPFRYLSLNAYTTLACAYRVRANDILALNYDPERRNPEAFNMHKTGTAYSLLLAGGTHHLFTSEPALIATVANFWISAGESILNLSRSSLWGPSRLDCTSVLTQKCSNCDILEAESVSQSRVYNCIADIATKVWSMLASESGFLREIRNPVDFSWLAYQESRPIVETPQSESEECDEKTRMNLVSLGSHCLRYGALLSSVCYGLSSETNYHRRLLCFLE